MNEGYVGGEVPVSRRLVAPVWHTALLIAILLGLAAYGFSMQRRAPAHLAERTGSALPLYTSLIAAQWLLLRFVTAAGLRRTGSRLRDLLGERWRSWREVARDVAIALVVWGVWGLAEAGGNRIFGPDSGNAISALLPRGPAETGLWILLSLSAGFCEETVFRGYLQRQFLALTGSVPLAVLIQAVIFGISHGYQGLRNVVTITIFGFLFGGIAAWRRSLKPGMILHAWTDIFSGIFARR